MVRFLQAIALLIIICSLVSCSSDSSEKCCDSMVSGARDALRRRGFQADSMTFNRPSPDDSTIIYTFISDRRDVDRLILGFELRPYDVSSRRYLRSQRDSDPSIWRNDRRLFWSTAPGQSLRFSLQLNHKKSESEIELIFDHNDGSSSEAHGEFLGSLCYGDTTTFKAILESGIDLYAPYLSGAPIGIEALELAYVRGEMALVRQLLNMGVPPCDPVGLGGNALAQPALKGDVETIRMLLEWYPEWNGPCIVGAARTAASAGEVGILDLLVAHGLDINVLSPTWDIPGRPFDPDSESEYCAQTLLMVAAKNGHIDCVEYLIAHGARLDVVTECRGKLGAISRWTALSLAKNKGHHEIVRLLEEALETTD